MDNVNLLLLTALNQMQHPCFIKDVERRYQYVNEKAAALADLKPSDFLGRKDEEIFGEEVGKIYRQKDEAILLGQSIHPLDVFTDAKGVTRTYFIVRELLLNEHQKPMGILGLRVDVSEYRQDFL